MRETVVDRTGRTELRLPRPVAAAFSAFAGSLTGRSSIIWGEHCSECAFPLCYSTCAYYTPRADMHCRRFEHGIQPVARQPGGVRLHRIRFRKWGKLEGHGPAPFRPAGAARRAETVDAIISGVLSKVPAPYRVTRGLALHWNKRKRKASFRPFVVKEQAFVVEGWAVDRGTHPFTVTFLSRSGETDGMYQSSFTVGPDYTRLVLPVGEITARVDLNAPFLIQVEPIGDAEGRDVVFGFVDFAAFKGGLPDSIGFSAQACRPLAFEPVIAARPAQHVKVAVWDLDETLWTGSLAEDGVAGVTPRPEAVAAIQALDERGVLQSIASKNDQAEALAALETFGLRDYFLHPQINWSPKSDSVARIAAALDLGVDSFLFIDDQPFERGEVAAAHPAIRTLSDTAVPTLLDEPYLDLPVTPEGGRRRAMYQEEADRASALAVAGTDYLGFLRESGMTLAVSLLSESDLERVYELSQRTNQLNFTGAKFSREHVRQLLGADTGLACLTMRCNDRFGDYGLIGFAVLDLAEGVLLDFFMSCRVQRKRVEQAFFALLLELVSKRGHRLLRARFRRTERNKASVEMLTELGFTAEAGAGDWVRSVTEPIPDAHVVRLVLARGPTGPALKESA